MQGKQANSDGVSTAEADTVRFASLQLGGLVRREVAAISRDYRSHATPQGAFDQYLLDIQRLPMITDPEEEKRLARRAQRGDAQAAERLVTANLRFVIAYVKKYQGHGLDLSELVAIGNEGLLKAVRKFDPDHGVKFISYAVWWIRQAILSALARQGRTVRVPLNRTADLSRIIKASEILRQKLNREPSPEELSQLTGLSVDVVQSLAPLGQP